MELHPDGQDRFSQSDEEGEEDDDSDDARSSTSAETDQRSSKSNNGKKETQYRIYEGKFQRIPQKITRNGLRLRISHLIFMTNQAFCFGENKYFQELMWYLNPAVPTKSRFTAQRDIMHVYAVYKNVIKSMLAKTMARGTLFGATTDIWSTKSQKRA